MNTLVEMINSMEVREDDETFKNAVDYMFDGLERRSPCLLYTSHHRHHDQRLYEPA